MRHLLIIILLFAFLACGKKESKAPASETSPSAPQMKKMDSANRELADAEDEIAEAPADKGKLKQEVKEEDGVIEKPLDPISDASKSRLLEYTIQLNYKVENIEKAREILLSVIKKESYIASSQTNHSTVSAMYDTLLLMDKVGQLTYEDIRTQDWTEHNELQKIKLTREGLRMIRRSKAANKDSAETWNWKDREEALERSEDSADSAKLETWKIKDHVTWAKVHISISGRELPSKIQLPNYKDAFVEALNFLLSLTYYIVFMIPLTLLGFLLFKAYRWYRNR